MSTKRIAEITLLLEEAKNNPILVAELVDLKVEKDMDKVMQRFDQMDQQFNSIKYKSIFPIIQRESSFAVVPFKIKSLNLTINSFAVNGLLLIIYIFTQNL